MARCCRAEAQIAALGLSLRIRGPVPALCFLSRQQLAGYQGVPEGDGYREPVRSVENYGGLGACTDSRDLMHQPQRVARVSCWRVVGLRSVPEDAISGVGIFNTASIARWSPGPRAGRRPDRAREADREGNGNSVHPVSRHDGVRLPKYGAGGWPATILPSGHRRPPGAQAARRRHAQRGHRQLAPSPCRCDARASRAPGRAAGRTRPTWRRDPRAGWGGAYRAHGT